jgi:hypothetical protein
MFRVNQLVTAKDDLNFYSSLFDMRHAATQRLSFRRSLRRVSKQWLAQQQRQNRDLLGTNVLVVAPTRQTRSNADVETRGWCLPRTGRTPARKVAEWYQNDSSTSQLEAMIKQRKQNCPGLPVYRVGEDENEKGKGGRGSCAQCHKPNSNIFCGICHTWLCGPHIPLRQAATEPHFIFCSLENAAAVSPPTRLLSSAASGTNGIMFRNSCWHIWHGEAYKNMSMMTNREFFLGFEDLHPVSK